MAESDKIVNGVIGAYRRSLSRLTVGTDDWIRRNDEVSALESILEELRHLRSVTKPVPKTLGDISDLPDELKAELSAIKTDDVEDQIFTIINSCEGKEANIDTILVELFRRFQGVHKRTYITNKLWRMVNKSEMLWGGDGGKGYYTTKQPTQLEQLEHRLVNGLKPVVDLDDEIPF